MKYTQNLKIMQITPETLVVGVDIAKETHYARVFDYRGIELGKVFRFSNTFEGFVQFNNWIQGIMSQQQKQSCIVGLEPTGHYWFGLAHFLQEHQIKLVLVNPFHVKRSKELDDNSPTKNDKKDPKTIAMLIKDGRFVEPYLPDSVYADLRIAIDLRERHLKDLSSIKNRVIRWLDIYFPEFNTVFQDWEGKTALMTLKELALPARIAKMEAFAILTFWRQEVKRGVGIKKAEQLVEAAKTSIGVKKAGRMAQYEIASLIEQYEVYMRQLTETEQYIEEMVLQIPGASAALEMKGVSVLTIAGFLSETGDLSRFEVAKQVQKLAGLNLKENSSGQHKGQTTITKRGRRRLRGLLFRAILPIVAKNEEFRELHQYYTTRKNNPLKKMQSLTLLCCKLIRILFAMIKKNIKYDGQKMMDDIKRLHLQEAS
jgi:transposase